MKKENKAANLSKLFDKRLSSLQSGFRGWCTVSFCYSGYSKIGVDIHAVVKIRVNFYNAIMWGKCDNVVNVHTPEIGLQLC